jgi:hypothetical protein
MQHLQFQNLKELIYFSGHGVSFTALENREGKAAVPSQGFIPEKGSLPITGKEKSQQADGKKGFAHRIKIQKNPFGERVFVIRG